MLETKERLCDRGIRGGRDNVKGEKGGGMERVTGENKVRRRGEKRGRLAV